MCNYNIRYNFAVLWFLITFQNKTHKHMKNKPVIRLHRNDSFLLVLLPPFFNVVLFFLSCCKNSGVISIVRLFIQSMILYMKNLFFVYKNFNELLYRHQPWCIFDIKLRFLLKFFDYMLPKHLLFL